MESVRVTVVVPVKNEDELLGRQLDALRRQEMGERPGGGDRGRWEVIVADNGSTDQTMRVALSYHEHMDNLRVVDAGDKPGASHARNVGAELAKGEIIAFCDADDVAEPGWLAGLVDAIDTGYDLVGGPLLTGQINEGPSASRPAPIIDALPSRWDFLPFAYSANMAMRAKLLADLGGFEEAFTCGGEDVDLCWRAQLAGHSVGFAADAKLHYRVRDEPGDIFRQTYRYGLTDPALYRRFRSKGMGRPSPTAALGRWAWLAKHVADLAKPGTKRDWWMLTAGYCAGRIVGSIDERVLAL